MCDKKIMILAVWARGCCPKHSNSQSWIKIPFVGRQRRRWITLWVYNTLVSLPYCSSHPSHCVSLHTVSLPLADHCCHHSYSQRFRLSGGGTVRVFEPTIIHLSHYPTTSHPFSLLSAPKLGKLDQDFARKFSLHKIKTQVSFKTTCLGYIVKVITKKNVSL